MRNLLVGLVGFVGCFFFVAPRIATAEPPAVQGYTLTTQSRLKATDRREAREETEQRSGRVVFGAMGHADASEAGSDVQDLDAGVFTTLDAEGRATQRGSTTGLAAFRVLELQNRIRLNDVLRSGGLNADSSDPTLARDVEDLETLFGVRWTREVAGLPRVGRVLEADGPDRFRLLRDGEEVASAELRPAGERPPPAAYGLFLRGRKVHPDLMDAVVGSGRWVRRLSTTWRDGFGEQREAWTFAEPAEADPADARLLEASGTHLAPAPADAGPVAEALRLADRLRLGDTDGLPARRTAERLTASMEAALEAERFVDAWLFALERFFQDGVAPGADLRRIAAAAGDDEAFAAYTRAADADSGTGGDLRSFDPEGLEQAHVARLLAANVTDDTGDTATSRALLAGVLGVNPHLTGAWLDLGTMLNRDFETPTGFVFVETAVRLQPDHPMLERATAFVSQIREDFPGLFLPD